MHVCVSMCVCLPVCVCLHVHVSVWASVSVHEFISLCLCVCLRMCLDNSVSASVTILISSSNFLFLFSPSVFSSVVKYICPAFLLITRFNLLAVFKILEYAFPTLFPEISSCPVFFLLYSFFQSPIIFKPWFRFLHLFMPFFFFCR